MITRTIQIMFKISTAGNNTIVSFYISAGFLTEIWMFADIAATELTMGDRLQKKWHSSAET